MNKYNKMGLAGLVLAAAGTGILGSYAYAEDNQDNEKNKREALAQEHEDKSNAALAGSVILNLLGIKAKTPVNASRLEVLSNATKDYSDKQSDQAAAIRSREDVNVNVNVNNQQPNVNNQIQKQPQEKPYVNPISGGKTPYSMAFIYRDDKKKDGNVYLDDLIGAGKSFDLSMLKRFSLATYVENQKGKCLDFYIYDSDSKPVGIESFEITRNDFVWYLDFDAEKFAKVLKARGKMGNFTINWRVREKEEPKEKGKIYDAYEVYLKDGSN